MGYRSTSYRGGYRQDITAGRVSRVNRRPGNCRACGELIPAGAGQLWRESSGAWSVVHRESSQGGWLMHPEPVRGGCPADTDRRNAELHASGFFGKDAPAPVSEREHIAATAARWAASNPAPVRQASRAGLGYAVLNSGAVVRSSSNRCEDAPCCGCCD